MDHRQWSMVYRPRSMVQSKIIRGVAVLDLQLALQLKEAGLLWRPAKRDNFTLPGSDLAGEVFTITDRTTLVERFSGEWTVTFHGAMEWALDSVLLSDVVWLPSETQLREAIQLHLGGDKPMVTLKWSLEGYRCSIRHSGRQHSFSAATAEAAYGRALLFLLNQDRSEPST